MRKLIRPIVALTGALFACLALAGAARADTYPVNDPFDLPDAAVGNGVCATAAGTCTLRAAIQEANAHAGPDTVTVPAGTFLLTRTGTFEANAATGDLDLRETITIAGAGRGLTIVDGNLTDRVFDVFASPTNTPMTATLTGLTIRRGGNVSTGCGMDVNGSQTRVFVSQVDIRNGACLNSFGYGGIYFSNAYLLSMDDVVIENNSGYYGGGIYVNGGRVVISGTLISNNSNQSSGGGGNFQNGFVSIYRSAIVDNRSSNGGGGVYLYYSSGGGITGTTIAGNSASSGGGGLYFYYANPVAFGWNTIARNSSASFGGGVYNSYGTLTVRGTLIGANAAAVSGPDAYCYGSLVSSGNSLIGDVTQCASSYYYSAGAGDVINVNPGVGAPIALGGTKVVPLVYGSRAIDAGGATCPVIDQRGQPRPADGNGDGSAVCDIGAYESQFGELSLSGSVYADTDLNGAWNTGVEPGVPGVTITLADLGSGQIVTSNTGADGSFAFGALATGTYVLREVQPAAFDDGVDGLGTAGGVLGDDVMTVSLVAATPALSYTFGEYPFAVLTGTVYGDYTGNGAYDPPTEGGIFNVTLGLAGTTARGQPLSLSASTDGAGTFTFFPVPPGVYTLTETQPGSYFDGEEAVGTAGGLVTGPAPTFDIIANIPVTYGVPVTGYLFGELNPRTISALVYADLNGNGVYEYNDDYISGQAVQLAGITYRGDVFSLTLLTDLYGGASFSGLAPGVYTLTETQPEA